MKTSLALSDIPMEEKVALRLMGLSTTLTVYRNGKKLINGLDFFHVSGADFVRFRDPCKEGDVIYFFEDVPAMLCGEQHTASEGLQDVHLRTNPR